MSQWTSTASAINRSLAEIVSADEQQGAGDFDQTGLKGTSRCAVTFHVRACTEPNERVYLVGSVPELGNWQVLDGVKLVTREELYPFWTTSAPVSLPFGALIEYKYVICGPSSEKWERPINYRVVVPTGAAMTVNDDDSFGRESPVTGAEPKHYQKCCGESPIIPAVAALTSAGGDRASGARIASLSDESAMGLSGDHIAKPLWRDPTEAVKALQSDYGSQDFLNENTTVLIISFELPLRVVRTASGDLSVERHKSLVMPQLHALRKSVKCRVKFVGWCGMFVPPEDKKKVEDLLELHDCIPVHLTEEALDTFLKFSHQCLWPLFHSVIALQSYDKRPFNLQEWMWYQNVNRQFAEIVAREAHETDLIWIHDYYLLLVPQFITRRIRKANVGLFLHIPFPSSEIFRCLPVREEILRGMLCADLVGFHFFEYARHFLVANKRLLGLDHHFRRGGFLELDYCGRNVTIGIGHVHVQYEALRNMVKESDIVKRYAEEFRQQYSGRFLFVSIDRCERLAGIILKLRGFQHFLRNYSYASSRAVLVQYLYPTVYNWDDQGGYYKELQQLTAEINAEFCDLSKEPVVVLNMQSIDPEKKYALLQCAGCLLDTSVRDGLNLTPFEYICCREDNPAPLILSEFTGCCRTLASAMRVNPWKSQDVARVMDRAMNFSADELQDAFLRDQTYLQRNSTLQWAKEFLLDLHRARKKEDLLYVSWGFGTGYRVYGIDLQFQHLNCEVVVQAFKDARSPVLFFDHEGTLAPDRRHIRSVPGLEALTATGSAPSPQIREYIKQLCSAGVTVVILSGRNRAFLEEWFGGILELGLCAEHGFYYKVPQITGNEWKSILTATSEKDFVWKDIAMELLKQYVKRTQGAFIENKGSALVFQYRDADPDFGSWQAKELSSYLEELLLGCPVTIMSGKGYVEVKLRGVSKGHAVALVLDKLNAKKEPGTSGVDFILCIGDDRSDEDMFPVVNSFFEDSSTASATRSLGVTTPSNGMSAVAHSTENTGAGSVVNKDMDKGGLTHLSVDKASPFVSSSEEYNGHGSSRDLGSLKYDLQGYSRSNGPKVTLPVGFSVTVGKKPSNAKFYLNDIDEVPDLLLALSQQAEKKRLSLVDLHQLKSQKSSSAAPSL